MAGLDPAIQPNASEQRRAAIGRVLDPATTADAAWIDTSVKRADK
jgi:hypothetical protein